MPTSRIAIPTVVYGFFAAVAWAWRQSAGASVWHDTTTLSGTRAISLPLGVSIGALVGALAVIVSRSLATRTHWGQALRSTLSDTLVDVPRREFSVFVLAVSAALGEELLFRGALLPELSEQIGSLYATAVTAVLFGLLHASWRRALIAWALSATVMGVVFAALYLATGEVLAPVAAHAVINHENLRFLLHTSLKPSPESESHPMV